MEMDFCCAVVTEYFVFWVEYESSESARDKQHILKSIWTSMDNIQIELTMWFTNFVDLVEHVH